PAVARWPAGRSARRTACPITRVHAQRAVALEIVRAYAHTSTRGVRGGCNDNGKRARTERSETVGVIGRLDGQVDTVLIAPLKREQDKDEQEQERAQVEPQTERIRERKDEAHELPSWLL